MQNVFRINSSATIHSNQSKLKLNLPRHLSSVTTWSNDDPSCTCARLLHRCCLSRSLLHGLCVHHFMVDQGIHQNGQLSDSLLDMYGRCGSPKDALAAFRLMDCPSVASWNFVIKAYSAQMKEMDALLLFARMHIEVLLPNGFSFVTILSMVSGPEKLHSGKWMHSRIISAAMSSDVVIGTALVHMYNKCGSLENARHVFDDIREMDTVLWNAMILSYVHHGIVRDAFYLFSEMQHQGMAPNRATFLTLIALCSKHELVFEGKWVYSCIVVNGYDGNAIVGSALLSMYGKCKCLDDACKVFMNLPQDDVALWNSIISAYSQNEMGNDAISLFSKMHNKAVLPDAISFVGILSACASLGTLHIGKQIHVQTCIKGFDKNNILKNALLNMYGKCGSFGDALQAFQCMNVRDIYSWNSILAGCGKHEKTFLTLQLYMQMQEEGVMPDAVSFVSRLLACLEPIMLSEGKMAHVSVISSKSKLDAILGTAVVNMYGKCNSPEEAKAVFDGMHDRNLYSWNAVIAAYAWKGKSNNSFLIFERMLCEAVLLDKITFSSILSSCSSREDTRHGKQLHAQSVACGFDSDFLVGNPLINMYARCGQVQNATYVFDKIESPDLVSWNACIVAHAHNGHCYESHHIFNQLLCEGFFPDKYTLTTVLCICSGQSTILKAKQLHTLICSNFLDLDVVVSNALINAYGKCDSLENALRTFYCMKRHDYVTFVSVISICAIQVALGEGNNVHTMILEHGLEDIIVVTNSILNMYGKCGSLEDTKRIFNRIQHPDVVSWNIMIAAYAQYGQIPKAWSLFRQMLVAGIVPDKTTFVTVLSACSHEGLTEVGWYFLNYMNQQWHLTPSTDHYNCMIDLLGRAGLIVEAEALLSKMPVERSVISWMTLLGACRNQVDIETGVRAAEGLLSLDQDRTAPYILLSNMLVGSVYLDITLAS